MLQTEDAIPIDYQPGSLHMHHLLHVSAVLPVIRQVPGFHSQDQVEVIDSRTLDLLHLWIAFGTFLVEPVVNLLWLYHAPETRSHT